MVTSHFMADNVEYLDLCGGGVEADERLQDVEDLRLAAVEHVLAQVHVQRLRVRRQRVVPAQESSAFWTRGLGARSNKNEGGNLKKIMKRRTLF